MSRFSNYVTSVVGAVSFLGGGELLIAAQNDGEAGAECERNRTPAVEVVCDRNEDLEGLLRVTGYLLVGIGNITVVAAATSYLSKRNY